jgi:SPP1 gp7 family putative phage head morphogenesis protein
MTTSNEAIFDAAVRHQVNLQRLSKGEANKILRMLEKSDKELVALIMKRAEGLSTDFTTARWQAMRKEIARTRSAVIRSVGGEIGDTMQDLAVLEQDIAKLGLQRSVPVEINFATTSPATLRSLAQDSPFGSADQVRTLDEWMTDLEQVDRGRITSALQAGVQNGETIPQITRRVQNAAELTQQNAEAIARTGVNHISNAAREEFFKENDDVILALRWVSTLDGRTSAICRARDGHFALPDGSSRTSVPSPAIQGSPVRPPAHLRCRSLMIAVLDSDAVADGLPERPTVRDTRTGRQREHDFRKDARAKAGDDWKGMSREERNKAIRDVRRDWAKKHVGHVPGETTYDEWLRRQDKAFQNEVLGTAKAKKFREGLEMDQFVDRSGNELTVAQLKEKTPPASKLSAADREVTTARDVDAKAKRAEQRAATARKREADARAAAEKHEADAKRLREEQAAQKKEAREAAAERKAEQERKARDAREKKAAETKAKREDAQKRAKAKEEARTEKAEKRLAEEKAKKATEKKRLAEEKAAQKRQDKLDAEKKAAKERD